MVKHFQNCQTRVFRCIVSFLARLMSNPLLLHQLPFRFAILAAVAFQVVHIQTAWCQTNISEATARSSKSTTQTTENAAGKTTFPAASKAVTVDPNVTTAHLKLFVKPLTVEELDVEAKGWQALLKNNVEKITTLHLRIEQVTDQIAGL